MFKKVFQQMLSSHIIHLRSPLLRLSTAMSTIPLQMAPELQKKYAIIRDIKSCLTFTDLNEVTEKHFIEINKYLKTVYFQALNSLYTETHEVEFQDIRLAYERMDKFTDLNCYEMCMRISALNKAAIYWQNKDEFMVRFKRYESEIMEKLLNQNHSVATLFNILFIFRIEQSPSILTQILGQIDAKIHELQNWGQLHRVWNLLLVWINSTPVGILFRYKNILRILSDPKFMKFNPLTKDEEILPAFKTFSKLKLHKSSALSVPKILVQSIHILSNRIDQLPNTSIILLGLYLGYLPKSLNPNFQKSIKERFNLIPPQKFIHYYSSISLDMLTQQQIGIIFKSDKMLTDFLWETLFNLTADRSSRGRLNNKIKEIFLKIFEEIIKNKREISTLRDFFRFLWISEYLLANGHSECQQEMKNILQGIIKKDYFTAMVMHKNIVAIFNFLEVVKDDPAFQKQIDQCVSALRSKMNQQFTSILNHHSKSKILGSLKKHCHSKVRSVKYLVRIMQQYLQETQKQLKDFYYYSLPLILQIFKGELSQENATFVEKILKKVPSTELNFVIQQMAQEDLVTPHFVANFLNSIPDEKFNINHAILMISLLNPTSLKNSRGIPHKKLILTLSKKYRDIDVTISNFNYINRFFAVALNFVGLSGVLAEIYGIVAMKISTLILEEESNKIEIGSMLLMDFIGKLEIIFKDTKNKSVQMRRILLERFNLIFEKLASKEGGLLFQTKYLEFVIQHQKQLPSNQGKQISLLFNIQEDISEKYDIHKSPLVLLILLKNYCLGLLELSEHHAKEYYQLIHNGIQLEYITVESFEQQISLIANKFYPSSTHQRLQNFLAPLLIEIIKKSQQRKSFYLYKDLVRFFVEIGDKQSVLYLCKEMMTLFLHPKQLQFFCNSVPGHYYDWQLIELLIQKLIANKKNLKFDAFYFLFFLENFYYEIPEKHQAIQQFLIDIVVKSMNSMVSDWNKKSFLTRNICHRIIKQLFCVIKMSKCNQLQNVPALRKILKENEKVFFQSFERSIVLTRAIHLIYYYFEVNTKSVPSQIKVHQPLLQSYLKEREIPWSHFEKKDSFVVQYYLPNSNEAVLVCKKHMLNHLGELKYHGSVKFEKQLIEMATGLSVRIFNPNTLELE